MAFKKKIEEKILDVDAAMQGTLKFKEPVNLRINGRFEGTLEIKGNLTIGQTAIVLADIIGDTKKCEALFVGNMATVRSNRQCERPAYSPTKEPSSAIRK